MCLSFVAPNLAVAKYGLWNCKLNQKFVFSNSFFWLFYISKIFPSFQEQSTQKESVYVSLSVLLACMMRKWKHLQEKTTIMGLPIYFTFLHITAGGDHCIFLGIVNKGSLLFTLGLNFNWNHTSVQSGGIAVYLIVDSIIFCSLLW